MKRAILIGITLLYSVVVLVAPYIIGNRVEQQTAAFFHSTAHQELAEHGINLTLIHFDKGYFGSQATVRLVIHNSVSGRVLYSENIHVVIKHSPLLFSGLDIVVADAFGVSQPSGFLGQYVSKDFASLHIRQNLFDLILGHYSGRNTLRLEPVDIRQKNMDIHFKGLVLDGRPLVDNDGQIDARFLGIDIQDKNNIQFSVQPVNMRLNIGVADKHGGQVGLVLNQLTLNAQKLLTNRQFYLALDGLHGVISMFTLSSKNNKKIISPRAVSLSFDTLSLKIDKGMQSGGLSIENAYMQLGFVPDGQQYRIVFILKGKPIFTGIFTKFVPLQPNDVDIQITVGSFSQEVVVNTLHKLRSIVEHNQWSTSVFLQLAMDVIMANITKTDLNINIDSHIDNASGRLLRIKGEIKEQISQDTDLMNLIFAPQKNLPRYFYGSVLSVFVSDAFLKLTQLDALLRKKDILIAPLLEDARGNLQVDVKVTNNKLLIHGT